MTRRARTLVSISYALYVPLWIALAWFDVELIKHFFPLKGVTACLFCGGPLLLAAGILSCAWIAHQTVILARQAPKIWEFALAVILMTLFMLSIVVGMPIATYIVTWRFLD